MAEYRTIKKAFWSDPDIEEMTMPVAHLYLYLITCGHTNNLGIAKISLRRIAMEAHFQNIEEAKNAFQELESLGKIKRVGEYVIIKNFIRHQTNTSPKIIQNMKKEAQDIPSEVLDTLFIWYPELRDTLSIPYPYPIDRVSETQNTPPIPYGEKEREREYEKEQEKEIEEEVKLKVENPRKVSEKGKIKFNLATGEWQGITEPILSELKEKYPELDVKQELLNMAEWLLQKKKSYKNWWRFITNWLNKADISLKTEQNNEQIPEKYQRILDWYSKPANKVKSPEALFQKDLPAIEEYIDKYGEDDFWDFFDYMANRAPDPTPFHFREELEKRLIEGKGEQNDPDFQPVDMSQIFGNLAEKMTFQPAEEITEEDIQELKQTVKAQPAKLKQFNPAEYKEKVRNILEANPEMADNLLKYAVDQEKEKIIREVIGELNIDVPF